MPNYQTILAAVDFSDHTKEVIQRALSEANNNCARIVVLNVVDHAWPTDTDVVLPLFDETEEKLVKTAIERLDDVLKSCSEPPAERLVTVGRPIQEILKVAEREKADLIVIGAHGHRGLRGILGSTTDRVVHQANCDVLVVHH
jgi:universal stress protein A